MMENKSELTITKRLDETLDAVTKCKNISKDIEEASKVLIEAYKNGKKLIICGNGGSAADAQHIAAEFVGKFYRIDRPALPAVALSTNTSSITAIGNDFGYNLTFKRGVEAFGQEGDVVWGISTSGNSENIIEAIKIAKTRGIKTIALTGENGGKMAEIADIAIKAPSSNTPIVQNCHITISHIICEIVENAF
jgi:D-sedoheptulose 7-phosphate isomerase